MTNPARDQALAEVGSRALDAIRKLGEDLAVYQRAIQSAVADKDAERLHVLTQGLTALRNAKLEVKRYCVDGGYYASYNEALDIQQRLNALYDSYHPIVDILQS